MKPNASLKSRNVNFLLMASRPFTSLQPLSLASALWRAAPVNFSAMVRTSWSPRLCHESPSAGHSQRRLERLPKSRAQPAAEGPMSWSLNIGTIAGTAVRVHVTFLLFLFACVVAHEFGHIFTARAFGVSTPDVTLLPIGGVARLERIPEEPYEEFLVAIAGPLVNVAIAIALVLLAGALVNAADLYTVESPHPSMIDRLAAVNLFLAVFNLIPAFPMDGGRVLRALLATRMGYVRATEIAAFIGQGFAFALGFIGLFFNPLLIFIAIFVYLAASSEAHLVAIRA